MAKVVYDNRAKVQCGLYTYFLNERTKVQCGLYILFERKKNTTLFPSGEASPENDLGQTSTIKILHGQSETPRLAAL